MPTQSQAAPGSYYTCMQPASACNRGAGHTRPAYLSSQALTERCAGAPCEPRTVCWHLLARQHLPDVAQPPRVQQQTQPQPCLPCHVPVHGPRRPSACARWLSPLRPIPSPLHSTLFLLRIYYTLTSNLARCCCYAAPSVVIKGREDEEAVLCTSRRTYAMKLVETTNLQLLVQPQEEAGQQHKGQQQVGRVYVAAVGSCADALHGG